MPSLFARVGIAARALFRSPGVTALALERAWLKDAVGTYPADGDPRVMGMLGGIFPGSRGEPPPRGTAEYLRAYSTMPWVRAVADRTGYGTAAAVWQVKALKGRDGKYFRDPILQRADAPTRTKLLAAYKAAGVEPVELTDHPLLTILHSGNDMMTGLSVRALTQIYLDLVGEAFMLKQRNAAGAPVGLWPLPPHWVRETPTPAAPRYHLQVNAWQDDIPDTEVLWLKRPDPLNPYGRGSGVTQALGDEIQTDEYAAKMTVARMYNQARPDIIVSPKEGTSELKEDQVKRIERAWLQKYRGFLKVALPHFASRPIDVKVISQTLEELQHVPLRQFERDVIIQVWGMPPEQLGILENSNRACYDADTECLTDRGWLRHGDLQLTDKVAAYDPVRGELRFEEPRQIVRYRYEGKMLHFASPAGERGRRCNVDILVTPDHRMWVRPAMRHPNAANRWQERRAHELEGCAPNRWVTVAAAPLAAADPPAIELPASPTRPNKRPAVRIPVRVWAPMLGLLASEGTWGRYKTSNRGGVPSYQISISQSSTANPEKVSAIDELVATFPIPCSRYLDSGGTVRWQWNHEALLCHLEQHCGPRSESRRLPSYIRAWPAWAQRSVIEWAILGDGTPVGQPNGSSETRRTWRSWQLYSTSALLLEDYQEAALKSGLRAGPVRRSYDASEERHACYRIGISEHVEPQLPVPVSEPYNGTVWCLETTTGWFVTRRHGCIAIQGNTIDAADLLFAKNILVPRLEFQREYYQERLVPEYDERLIVDYVSPVDEDKDRQAEARKAAPYTVQVNEWRAAQGLPPDERAGAGYMVPFTTTYVEDLTEGAGSSPSVSDGNGAGGSDGEQAGVDPSAALARLARRTGRPSVFRAGQYDAKAIAQDDDYYTLVHRVADRLSPKLRRQFLATISKIRDSVVLHDLENALASGQLAAAMATIPWARLEAELNGGAAIIRQALVAAGEASAAELGEALGVTLRFDRTNPAAVAWAQRNAARYVTEVSSATREAINELVVAAFEEQRAPQETARLIRDVIGLHSRQVGAVEKFRARLVEQGVDGDALAGRVEKYAAAQLRRRAKTIGDHETLTASNAGQRILWRQAREDGLLDYDRTRRRWINTPDDRLEVVCEEGPFHPDNQDVKIDGQFTSPRDARKFDGMPEHVKCRCAEGLEIDT